MLNPHHPYSLHQIKQLVLSRNFFVFPLRRNEDIDRQNKLTEAQNFNRLLLFVTGLRYLN
jgi:hypothetical protein